MTRQRGAFGGMSCAALAMLAIIPALTVPALAQPAQAQAPSFQIVNQDAGGVEIRFHGIPLRDVHADNSQNALSLDFQTPVDGAAFDRLAGAVPQWISMAYADYDSGVIRAPRPVTFLTRAEPDGFSLRIVARQGAPAQQQPAAYGPPPPMRGQYDTQGAPPPQNMAYGPPPAPPMPYGAAPIQARLSNYGVRGGLGGYAAHQLAVRRDDPIWQLAGRRANLRTNSGLGIRNSTNWYDGGDLMVNTHLDTKYTLLPGIAFVGDLQYTNVTGKNVRGPSGNIAPSIRTDLVTGIGGLAFELGGSSELQLQASEGNNTTGGKASLYIGSPDQFIALTGDYHTPYLDTPAAVWSGADRDQATIAGATRLGEGLWASAAGHFTNYGVHGDSHVASTAGWDANLRWTMPLAYGLLAGVSYDGFGEYHVRTDTYNGAAPTPYIPLGIRNIENHAATASLSAAIWQNLWFEAYGGYVRDRYSSDGLLAGMDLHFAPAPGWDLALGVRHSAVSYMQGETGSQTTAGLNLTMGFGAPPQPSWMFNTL
jgi:hypothetical protein